MIRFSSDFDENFPPSVLDEVEQQNQRRREIRNLRVVKWACVAFVVILAYFVLTAARAHV